MRTINKHAKTQRLGQKAFLLKLSTLAVTLTFNRVSTSLTYLTLHFPIASSFQDSSCVSTVVVRCSDDCVLQLWLLVIRRPVNTGAGEA